MLMYPFSGGYLGICGTDGYCTHNLVKCPNIQMYSISDLVYYGACDIGNSTADVECTFIELTLQVSTGVVLFIPSR